eukprot:g14052.t1
MATQITVNRKKSNLSTYTFNMNRFNTDVKVTEKTLKMGQAEIYRKLMPRNSMEDDDGNIRAVSPRLTKDTREGYRIIREMQHKAKAESVSHRGRHTKKGQLHSVPNIPKQPRNTRPHTSANAKRKLVNTATASQTPESNVHPARPKTSMGRPSESRAVRPQTAVGSYDIDNSDSRQSYPAEAGTNRSKSVVGYNTCLNIDTVLKKARPSSSIASRRMINVIGNHQAITNVARNLDASRKASGCTRITNLGSSNSAYLDNMSTFEKILDKKEKRDQIKRQMKSWKTKTKAHARKKKNQELARKMYKSGDEAAARKARSQNIKADRLRQMTPFSF